MPGFSFPHGATTVAALLLIACDPDVAEPPHASLQQLRRAVEAGDTAAAIQYVDPEAIVARLMRDVLATARDSSRASPDDTLPTVFQAAVDSVKREWVGLLRMQLGLSPLPTDPSDSTPPAPEAADTSESEVYPSEEIFAEAVEFVGDGRARYVGDTAFVDRVLRYGFYDTTATLRLALVPVGRSHWRIVAFDNAIALAMALRQRQVAMLERANERLRDSIYARVSTRDLSITREPLVEWGRYAAEVRATVENRGAEPLVLYAAQLVGPHLALEDTVAELLPDPLTLGPRSVGTILWRHDLRGDHSGLDDLVAQPSRYGVEITDLEWGDRPSYRIQLYRTWREFVRRNPRPTPTSGGVLAQAMVR